MELQPLDPLEAMRVGARLFLDGCSAPDVQQIVLIDAPAVLGWDRWRAVGVKYGLGVIEAMLAHAIAEGAVPEQPLRPTAHVLLGALDEAALYVSRAADREQARRRDGRRVRAADQRDRRARIACHDGRLDPDATVEKIDVGCPRVVVGSRGGARRGRSAGSRRCRPRSAYP